MSFNNDLIPKSIQLENSNKNNISNLLQKKIKEKDIELETKDIKSFDLSSYLLDNSFSLGSIVEISDKTPDSFNEQKQSKTTLLGTKRSFCKNFLNDNGDEDEDGWEMYNYLYEQSIEEEYLDLFDRASKRSRSDYENARSNKSKN